MQAVIVKQPGKPLILIFYNYTYVISKVTRLNFPLVPLKSLPPQILKFWSKYVSLLSQEKPTNSIVDQMLCS